jgi:hypothetical protein
MAGKGTDICSRKFFPLALVFLILAGTFAALEAIKIGFPTERNATSVT